MAVPTGRVVGAASVSLLGNHTVKDLLQGRYRNL